MWMFAYSVPLCDLYSAAVSCTENSASCGFLWILLLSLDKTCIKASKVQSCLIIRWRMQSSKLFTLHLVLASLLLLSVPWVGLVDTFLLLFGQICSAFPVLKMQWDLKLILHFSAAVNANMSIYAKHGICYLHELGGKLISTCKILDLCAFSDCSADLLQEYQIPSPLARCLLVYLALEKYFQILEARPESSTLSSWATIKFPLVCIHSSLESAFLFYQFH